MSSHSTVYDASRFILFFDLETSIKNRGEDAIGKHQASPYHPANKIVYSGWTWGDESPDFFYSGMSLEILNCFGCPREPKLLVAQNIAFDLSYLLQTDYHRTFGWIQRGGMIWDVMIAEYLLSGQELKFASLDELATIYGGELKDSRIKEYWKEGVDTEDIPKEEIIPYLETDVKNLRIIYEGQLAEAKRLGMLPLIESQMEARLATILMENNGMKFDVASAKAQEKVLAKQCEALEEELKELMVQLSWGRLTIDEVNPGSTQQVSAILFGGTLNVSRRVVVVDPTTGEPVLYKSGKKKGEIKTKLESVPVRLDAWTCTTDPPGKSGFYAVGDSVLKEVKATAGHALVKEFCDKLLEYRETSKQLNTYFSGYSQLVWPDGLIHGQLNHCQTATGRLSSSNPNLQNISNKSTDGGD